MPVSALLAACCGALVTGGVALGVIAAMPRPVKLSDALATLDGEPAVAVEPGQKTGDTDVFHKMGDRAYRRLGFLIPNRVIRQLAISGRPIGDFFAEKIILGTIGWLGSAAIIWVLSVGGIASGVWPASASLAVGVLAFFIPDLRVTQSARNTSQDAAEALFTYFDLVVLERLANKSAIQSLCSAAEISNSEIFRRIRGALEHAKLLQRPPWQDLHNLADELGLHQLADLANVMQLDEQGASLSDTLRGRVKELRNEHLAELKMQAQAKSESLTLPMVVPVAVFALLFLFPPLSKLLGG